MPKLRKPSTKQKVWCESYLRHFNATQAADDAEYKGNRATLAVIGSENLRKPYLKAYIEKRLAETVMTSNEVLSRLAEMARSFDVTEYATTKETYAIDKKGKAYFSGYAIDIDLKKLQKDGYSHLIKRIYATKGGSIAIEWHDQMAVLLHLDKQVRGGKIDLTSKGDKIAIIGFDSNKL